MPTGIILPHIERLTPYGSGVRPPEGNQTLRLHMNESPYPPSKQVLAALRTACEQSLRRYPDDRSGELRAALAKHYGVAEAQVICGNGSSELIALMFKTFVGAGGRAVIPDPSFPLYHTAAAAHRAACVRVPTRRDLSVDTGRLLASAGDARAIIAVNPNAPTGRLQPLEEIEWLVERFRGLVVIDEAYIDFAQNGASAIPLVAKYSNVLVLRTFSKSYALCGARVGCCFGNERLVAALAKAKDLYNVNAISSRLAIAALADQPHMERTAAAIGRTRASFSGALLRLGFDVVPSDANFVLCAPPADIGPDGAATLHARLMERGVYVRYFNEPRLRDKLRISIGTDAEMAEAAAALAALVGRGTD